MRVILDPDDEMIEDRREYTGVWETNVIVRKALGEMRQREAGRRAGRLKGAFPSLVAPPRRRFPAG